MVDLHLAGPQVGDGRHLLDRDRPAGDPLDVAEQAQLAWLGEGDRDALAPGPADPADAVHVGVGRRRHVVVDDVGQLVDVEAAGGDVGGDEQLGGAVAQAAHHPVAALLVHPAVQRLGPVAAAVERLGELVDLGARAAEDDRRGRRLDVEDAPERGRLVGPRRRRRRAGRRAARSRLAGARSISMRTGSRRWRLAMASMRGGRVAENSTVWRSVGRGAEDRLDVLGEAHVEHLVGLVEHDHADAVELQRAAVDVVDRPAGRGDDDVHAVAQGAELAADRLAAVDRQHPRAELAAVAVHRLGHLHGELAGRHEHEGDGLRPADGRIDQLQRRQGEGGRLAGAGGGLAEHVAAGEDRRDGVALDRRRLLVAERGEGGQQLRAQLEVGEPALARRARCARSWHPLEAAGLDLGGLAPARASGRRAARRCAARRCRRRTSRRAAGR